MALVQWIKTESHHLLQYRKMLSQDRRLWQRSYNEAFSLSLSLSRDDYANDTQEDANGVHKTTAVRVTQYPTKALDAKIHSFFVQLSKQSALARPRGEATIFYLNYERLHNLNFWRAPRKGMANALYLSMNGARQYWSFLSMIPIKETTNFVPPFFSGANKPRKGE